MKLSAIITYTTYSAWVVFITSNILGITHIPWNVIASLPLATLVSALIGLIVIFSNKEKMEEMAQKIVDKQKEA